MTGRFKYTKAASAIICLMLLCTYALAIPSRPEPPRLVNDFAGLFSRQQTAALESMLTAFNDSTSNQITVVTVTDLEGYDPAEYATRIGLDWGVGADRYDNGIVMLIKPKTADSRGQVNINVGYGLEGAIPDVYAKRIIDNEMIPRFAENEYFSGVYAGCEVLMKLASGEISDPDEASSSRPDGRLSMIVMIIIFILFLVGISRLFRNGSGRNNRNNGGGGPDLLDMIIIGNLLGSSHSSGRSSGGFSGGFGGSFGGFGGGSFGGGGASGSW